MWQAGWIVGRKEIELFRLRPHTSSAMSDAVAIEMEDTFRATPWNQATTKPQPKTTEPAFIGYIVKHDFHKTTVCKKTANHKGRTSRVRDGALTYGNLESVRQDQYSLYGSHWYCERPPSS